ncbi:PREDICTED: uncharacterized protein LOC108364037 [Rhagoletis zephyria]|uniref:uncharacterized protein LOC108364037 n=1 Tax=Rhagoletis zephyria TaxID=28612 RepID=UPI0008117D45|nr:PREDICTED: uncharacterized protein LOC108364037 [Rhagoletis zephyria]
MLEMTLLYIKILCLQLLTAFNLYILYLALSSITIEQTVMTFRSQWLELPFKVKNIQVSRYLHRKSSAQEYAFSNHKISVSHLLLIYYLSNCICAATLPPVIRLGCVMRNGQLPYTPLQASCCTKTISNISDSYETECPKFIALCVN